jgi:hypothetical protein
MGLEPVTRDAAPAGKQYPYVLFAAPPSGSEDYPGAVSDGRTGGWERGEGGAGGRGVGRGQRWWWLREQD